MYLCCSLSLLFISKFTSNISIIHVVTKNSEKYFKAISQANLKEVEEKISTLLSENFSNTFLATDIE